MVSCLKFCPPHCQISGYAPAIQSDHPEPCAACQFQARYGDGYTRQCPDTGNISEYLRQTSEFSAELTPHSRICTPCYFFHKRVLCEMKGRVTLKETTESCVSNLEERIKRFESGDPHLVSEKSYIEWNL